MREPSGEMATPFGSVPTVTWATRVLAPFLVSKILTLLLSGLATANSQSSALAASGCELVGPVKRAGVCADTGWSPVRIQSTPAPNNAAANSALFTRIVNRILCLHQWKRKRGQWQYSITRSFKKQG